MHFYSLSIVTNIKKKTKKKLAELWGPKNDAFFGSKFTMLADLNIDTDSDFDIVNRAGRATCPSAHTKKDGGETIKH